MQVNTKISIILWHNLVALWYFPIILWNYYSRQMTPSRFLGLQTTQNVTFIYASLEFFSNSCHFWWKKIHLLRCWTTRPTLVGWQVGAGLWSTPNAPRLTKRWFFLLPEVDLSFLGLWAGQQIMLLKDSTFMVPTDRRVTITITITIMEAILRKIKDYHTTTITLSPLAPLQISLARKTLKCCFRMWWIAAFSSATRIRCWR